ncbi:MAG: PIG-L family deacetylase [Chloroherpetonaceae bacterium]|nr:PIG-L family deacetylase [Chloroherpetonaceae bacterium]
MSSRWLRCNILLSLALLQHLVVQPTGYAKAAQTSTDSAHYVLIGLAAHPDDEDGATLAYYAKFYGKPVRVYNVFFTRGEGGQNEIGSALYEELGNIRTQETREAAEILGVTPIFLGFHDFGYSKTAKETFAKWGGKEAVLQKLVYLIRKLQPDVVITNHDTITTPPNRQHGHHQAVGISLYEAFEKAADSAYCPEHVALGAMPWQVKKMFVRIFRESPVGQDSIVRIDISATTPEGERIADIAARSLARHRSQGMDKLVQSGALRFFFQPRRYALWRAAKSFALDTTDFFAGIVPEVRRIEVVKEFVDAPKLSLFVSPASVAKVRATPAEFQKKEPAKYVRRFVVVMESTVGKILPVVLSVRRGSETLLRKDYLFKDKTTTRLVDTLSIALEKSSPFDSLTAEQLTFEARPIGVEAEALQLAKAVQHVELKPVEVKVARTVRVGLVRTYDNTMEETLAALGVKFERLDSTELATKDLRTFSTILVDMRAGEYRRDVLAHSKKLFEFVEQGGHIVAFYNKPQDWNPNKRLLAPYPIELTMERVVEEDAKVTVLRPKHPLLNVPNKIDQSDWNDWIQERSLYLPADDTTKTAPQYERLLAMSDEGEAQPPTSMLTAKVGKGTYTYVSLALYRQLKRLHTGALKLFSNLISQPRAK